MTAALPAAHDFRRSEWDASYTRGENFMFYPKEETVKFLNRHVRKRTGVTTFRDVLTPTEPGAALRGLDFGCGIGRQAILLQEFGIEAFGVDISPASIATAHTLADHFRYPELKARLTVVSELELPFADDFFDVTISSGVLDSMPFEMARRCMRELDRVTRRLGFIDLISGDDSLRHPEFANEVTVATPHEAGTVQSYFNFAKVEALIADTAFNIQTCRLMTEQSVVDRFRYSRYHVVLAK